MALFFFLLGMQWFWSSGWAWWAKDLRNASHWISSSLHPQTCPFNKRCLADFFSPWITGQFKGQRMPQSKPNGSTETLHRQYCSRFIWSWHLVSLAVTGWKSRKGVGLSSLSITFKRTDSGNSQQFTKHISPLDMVFVHSAFIFLGNDIHYRQLLKSSSCFESKVAKAEINLWFADIKLWHKWKTVSHMPF